MDLRQCILTENACYKSGNKITPSGVIIHSTGANNPNLRRYVQPDDGYLGVNSYNNHWNQPRPDGKQVCVHGFIGKLNDGSIATYQTLPWDMRSWGCGSGRNGSYNNSHIQIEICEGNLGDSEYFGLIYTEAVELSAYLCDMYEIDPDNICDHNEAFKAGYASNHADVSHWFPRHGRSMDSFRSDVKEELEKMTYEKWKKYYQDYIRELSKNDASGWSEKGRQFCVDNEIIVGDGSSYQWKVPLTREMMATMFERFANKLRMKP